MDLLREVRSQALDQGYQEYHDRSPGSTKRRPVGVAAVVILLVTGVLIGIAWRSTAARAPLDARERDRAGLSGDPIDGPRGADLPR